MLRRLVAVLLCLLFFSSPTVAQTELNSQQPVEVFGKLPFISGPSLSPDGKWFAALASVNGEQRFAIFPIGKAGHAAVIGTNGWDANWWTWVGNDWLVLGVGATKRFQTSDIYVNRAVRVSRDGRTIEQLAKASGGQDTGRLVWASQDGSNRVLLAVQDSIYWSEEFWPKVIEIDVATGKSRTVVDPIRTIWTWHADGAGNIRMGYGYDDAKRTAKFLYRETGRGRFKEIDRANYARDEELNGPAIFLKEPGKAFALDNSTGYLRLSEYDLATQTMGTSVFSVDGFDIDGIITNLEGDSALGVNYTDTRRRQHWLDPEFKQLQADLDKATPGRDARIISFSSDNSRMLVEVSAPDRMGAYYLFDRAVGTMVLLAYENDQLKSRPMAPVKTIAYKARDGLEIHAILTLPKGRDAKRLPLVVMPHGGPNARDLEEWDYWAQFVADRGYAVIQPNYRGSTGYGDPFTEAGEGEWGRKMQDDLLDAIDFLAASGTADDKRVCIVGGSYGGYAAMHAAERDPQRFRCAVAFAGISDLAALKRYDRTFLNRNAATEWLESRVNDLGSVSPINHIEAFGTPLLLVHGKEDLRVPVAQSRNLAKALQKAGKSVRYVELPKADHHLSRQDDRIAFLTELDAFLRQYNPVN